MTSGQTFVMTLCLAGFVLVALWGVFSNERERSARVEQRRSQRAIRDELARLVNDDDQRWWDGER